MERTRILIMAGGTGGHIFPALAVARGLIAQGIEVKWLGTQQGLEAKIVPDEGIDIDWINVSGLRGKGVVSWLSAPFNLMLAVKQAVQMIRRYQPNVVLGMGGFVSGPGGVAAWLLRKPLLIHEQNAVLGLTNRLLAPLARKVMQAFPGTFAKQKNALTTGNPVRENIADLALPEKRFSQRSGALRILIVGGSLGAKVFNEKMPKILSVLSANVRPVVWHQTGAKNLADTERMYTTAQVDGRIEAFIENMADAYAWSDLVVCRSGALTVSELASAGVASILVPYPHAVDDHQTENAKYLSERGAAILLPQDEFTDDVVSELLLKFSRSSGRDELLAMAQAARRLAKPDATGDVVCQCLEVAHA